MSIRHREKLKRDCNWSGEFTCLPEWLEFECNSGINRGREREKRRIESKTKAEKNRRIQFGCSF